MADQTTRFHLTRLTQATDSLGLEDYKFGTADRRTIDHLLRLALEDHIHDEATSPDELVQGAPLLNTDTEGGIMPASTRYFYRFSLIDPSGHETISSQVSSTITAGEVPPPLAPTVSLGPSASMTGGRYSFKVSAYTNTDATDETTMSPSVEIDVPVSGAVVVAMPSIPSGALGFNVYRRGPQDDRYYYVATTTDPTVTTGVATPTRSRPGPVKNTTHRSSQVSITLPFNPPTGYGWRIYRTANPMTWAGSLLTTIPIAASNLTFVDLGNSTIAGSPARTSPVVGSPTKILLTDAAEIEGILPPGMHATAEEVDFTFDGLLTTGATQPITWINEWERSLLLGYSATLGRDSVPAAQQVRADIKFFALGYGWVNVFAAYIPIGQQGTGYTPLTPWNVPQGTMFRLDVYQDGGGATPTDRDLTVTLKMLVLHGSATNSGTWT